VRYLQGTRAATYSWAGSHFPQTDDEVSALLASNANRKQWPWPAAVNQVVLDRENQRVTVVWNASPNPTEVALPAQGATAQLVDKRGQVTTVTPQAGVYRLSLEPSRNNSDPRDPTLYLVGGSPLILVEDLPSSAPSPP